MRIAFSASELVSSLVVLVRENLNCKQKNILIYLNENANLINVTAIVPKLAKELRCANSTIWNNLTSLKKSGLISYGSLANKGEPACLTKLGRLAAQELLRGGEKDDK